MNTYTVTIYVNVDPSRMNFLGYQGTHPIAKVDTFTVEADSPHGAAEAVWPVGNKMEPDATGKEYPVDVRSLSVGDMVETDGPDGKHYLACASVGWDEIPEPGNRVVPIEGTWATSRQVHES